MENLKIQFAEENTAEYVQEFALGQCKKLAADFKNIFAGVKDKIRMDIDVLVLSSESLEQLLDKLKALGYEIKHGREQDVRAVCPKAAQGRAATEANRKYLDDIINHLSKQILTITELISTRVKNSTQLPRSLKTKSRKIWNT